MRIFQSKSLKRVLRSRRLYEDILTIMQTCYRKSDNEPSNATILENWGVKYGPAYVFTLVMPLQG